MVTFATDWLPYDQNVYVKRLTFAELKDSHKDGFGCQGANVALVEMSWDDSKEGRKERERERVWPSFPSS